jgi:GNAT superfamily N-acetyltransferase
MNTILKPSVKFRIEGDQIFICDCKKLIDFKLDKLYIFSLEKLKKGIYPLQIINALDLSLFNSLEKYGFVSNFEIRNIRKSEFNDAFDIVNKELKLYRTKRFIRARFYVYHKLFFGIFIDNKIVGAVFGFPREDYLLLSEIAIRPQFQNRGFGKKLIEAFEKIGIKYGFKEIRLGCEKDKVGFYKKSGFKKTVEGSQIVMTKKLN